MSSAVPFSNPPVPSKSSEKITTCAFTKPAKNRMPKTATIKLGWLNLIVLVLLSALKKSNKRLTRPHTGIIVVFFQVFKFFKTRKAAIDDLGCH